MLVAGFAAAAFGTNVYVVAPAAGEHCVVIDPGVDVATGIDELLAEHKLEPVAVLLTHGHIDHTFSVVPVGTARGLAAYIHPADRDLLRDPMKGLSAQTRELFGGRLQWVEPADVRPIGPEPLQLAGMEFMVDHAPGHTPGSVMFRMVGGPDPAAGVPERAGQTMFSGDVLFAGSIGRTDLPGGSHEQMMQSLADKVLTLTDDTLVLPGHGEPTTVGRERNANPFLVGLAQPTSPARGL